MSTNVISTEALIAKFEQALHEQWGYIWGTAGEPWTAAKQKELERTTDADRAQGRQYGSKWIGHMVADCSGLFSWDRNFQQVILLCLRYRQHSYFLHKEE